MYLSYKYTHNSWHQCLSEAWQYINIDYRANLQLRQNWIPGPDNIFRAFTTPANKIKYLLLGEAPYPRRESANGYAFWDARVSNLWSPQGMSVEVNRATSLRNLLKMLLVAAGLLNPAQLKQADIAKISKTNLITTSHELFTNLLDHGFLLLNASLVLPTGQIGQEAKAWQPFLQHVVKFLLSNNPQLKYILFGKIAQAIASNLPITAVPALIAEHPYNISFISNQKVLEFFQRFNLLTATIKSQE
jgi:uracil-DNA glycosylase